MYYSWITVVEGIIIVWMLIPIGFYII